MKLQRTLAIAAAVVTLGAAGAALAGNPNPTESQDAYWDLRDQAAAWNEHRREKALAEERKTQEKATRPAPVAVPATARPEKG